MIPSELFSRQSRRFVGRFIILAVLTLTGWSLQAQPKLVLKQDDHIALLGGTLPERFQHTGFLETYIVARHPKLNLVVRNLAVSGDEITFRHRSENFGSPDEWLTRVGADVIFAFWGFNESFKGPEGLEKFKADLDKWIKDTKQQNYSGKGAPRIVLFSPIANERHQDPNFADPRKNNENILIYTGAMAEVATRNQVPLVNLFEPSQKLYSEAAAKKESLTINGIHLSPRGDELIAGAIFQQLFNEPAPSGDFAKLRAAINEKNEVWHSRYRTIDGYNVYGGRSQDGLTNPAKAGRRSPNFNVMQEEMSQRDVMTANRDKRVWAVAQGRRSRSGRLQPAARDARSNQTSPAQPRRTHAFLGGEEAITKMNVHAGPEGEPLRQRRSSSPSWSSPCRWRGTRRAACGSPRGRTIPSARPPAKWATSSSSSKTPNGDGKADKCTTVPRRPELPDRLPVLQGRRARHAGAGPVVRARHRRRRQGATGRSAC